MKGFRLRTRSNRSCRSERSTLGRDVEHREVGTEYCRSCSNEQWLEFRLRPRQVSLTAGTRPSLRSWVEVACSLFSLARFSRDRVGYPRPARLTYLVKMKDFIDRYVLVSDLIVISLQNLLAIQAHAKVLLVRSVGRVRGRNDIRQAGQPLQHDRVSSGRERRSVRIDQVSCNASSISRGHERIKDRLRATVNGRSREH